MSSLRVAKIRALLTTHACTHILITDVVEAHYLSGFSSSACTLLISEQTALLITDFRYAEAAKEHCKKNPLWQPRISSDSLPDILLSQGVLADSVIGFQDTAMTVAKYHALQASLAATYTPLGNEISALFAIKEAEEIAAMQKAAAIADKALEQLVPTILAGESEWAVARRLEQSCQELGSEGPSFSTIVLFGERTALPHGKPTTERLLQPGDWILIDFGCTFQGFCSDMTRTFIFQCATPQQRSLYNAVFLAQEAGRAQIKPGQSGIEADEIVRTVLTAEGYGEAFGHGTGHGVGRRVHEVPALNTKNETILQENMVVTIEPGAYIPGFGGVRIEDMVLLTSQGVHSLSTAPRELNILGPLPRSF